MHDGHSTGVQHLYACMCCALSYHGDVCMCSYIKNTKRSCNSLTDKSLMPLLACCSGVQEQGVGTGVCSQENPGEL
jgi:hypothetical protein